jgi:hypothetical protein
MPRRPWSPWIFDPLDVVAARPEVARVERPAGAASGGCLFGLLALGVLIVALVVASWTTSGRGSFLFDSVILRALPIAGLLLLAAKPLLDRRARLPLREERMFATSLGQALFGVVLGLATAKLLDHPLIHASDCSFWIGYDNPGVMTLPMALLFVVGMGASAAMLAGTEITAALTLAARRRARAAAWTALVAVAALVVASAVARWGRPDPLLGDYVTSLPEIGRVHEADDTEDPPQVEHAWTWSTIDGVEPVLGAAAPGLQLWQLPGLVAIQHTGEPLPTPDEIHHRGARFGDQGEPISIRRDARHGLIVLERAGARGNGVHDDVAGRAAFREPGLEAVNVRLADLHDLTGPPASWIAAACAGLAVALLVLWSPPGSPLSRAADQLPGLADGKGWIELDDGSTRVPVPAGQAIPRGPVVVIPLGLPRGATYRSTGGPGPILVVPGTVAGLRAAVDAAAANRAMLALAALSLTAAPLVACCGYGLVTFFP